MKSSKDFSKYCHYNLYAQCGGRKKNHLGVRERYVTLLDQYQSSVVNIPRSAILECCHPGKCDKEVDYWVTKIPERDWAFEEDLITFLSQFYTPKEINVICKRGKLKGYVLWVGSQIIKQNQHDYYVRLKPS